MEKIYKEAGCLFVKFSKETLEELKKLPVEEVFVSCETFEKIKKILNLEIRTAEELIAVRNSVVKELTKNDDRDNWTRMSMIVCVIDNEKIKRGMAV